MDFSVDILEIWIPFYNKINVYSDLLIDFSSIWLTYVCAYVHVPIIQYPMQNDIHI
jgi:hypothetical protein